MANYKKTETKNVDIETTVLTETVNENKEAETKEETVVIETKKKEKVFKQTDAIPCRSIINGALYIEGARSGIFYSWADYGDVQEIEYRDLLYMVRTREDRNIYTPRIIIEDDDFIEQNKSVKDLYESMYTTVDLRDIIHLPVKQMEAEINKLPNGVKESVKGIASTMINAHELDSVQKIKALDNIFGTNMILTLVQE